jgi:two-component system, cell cycle response regulator DivK
MSDSSSFPLPGEHHDDNSLPPEMHAAANERASECVGENSTLSAGEHANANANSSGGAPENFEASAQVYSEEFPQGQEALEIGADAGATMSLAEAADEAARSFGDTAAEATNEVDAPRGSGAAPEKLNLPLRENTENQNRLRDAGATKPDADAAASADTKSEYPPERRRRRRAMISAQVRVRTEDVTGSGPDEISTTVDVSRIGFLFLTTNPAYKRDMEVLVTFPFSNSPNAVQAEQPGRVARVNDTGDGRRAVAIAIGAVKQEIVDSGGRVLVTNETVREIMHEPVRESLSEPLRALSAPEKQPKKHLVLAVDASALIRETMKTYLTNEGYEVIAVETAADAREVLNMMTPSIVIAEIEGEGLPGYDLCAHVKTTPRLAHIPVVLTTSSAYPSDYSSAHSLGAVVCMAKPFKQERLGHVVRLLAPPPQSANQAQPPRAADPSRRAGANRISKTSRPGARGGTRGFRILPN